MRSFQSVGNATRGACYDIQPFSRTYNINVVNIRQHSAFSLHVLPRKGEALADGFKTDIILPQFVAHMFIKGHETPLRMSCVLYSSQLI